MSATSIYGLVDNETRANVLIGRLRDRGIALEEMSVLFPDLNAARAMIAAARPSKVHQNSTTLHASSVTSADSSGVTLGNGEPTRVAAPSLVAGGVVDGALGWLTGIGHLDVPGVGPLIVSGPLLLALSSLVGSETVGGISGALISLGFPGPQAHRYAEKLDVGCILIAVHARDKQAADIIQAVFTLTNVSDVGSAGDATGTANVDSAQLHPAEQE